MALANQVTLNCPIAYYSLEVEYYASFQDALDQVLSRLDTLYSSTPVWNTGSNIYYNSAFTVLADAGWYRYGSSIREGYLVTSEIAEDFVELGTEYLDETP